MNKKEISQITCIDKIHINITYKNTAFSKADFLRLLKTPCITSESKTKGYFWITVGDKKIKITFYFRNGLTIVCPVYFNGHTFYKEYFGLATNSKLKSLTNADTTQTGCTKEEWIHNQLPEAIMRSLTHLFYRLRGVLTSKVKNLNLNDQPLMYGYSLQELEVCCDIPIQKGFSAINNYILRDNINSVTSWNKRKGKFIYFKLYRYGVDGIVYVKKTNNASKVLRVELRFSSRNIREQTDHFQLIANTKCFSTSSELKAIICALVDYNLTHCPKILKPAPPYKDKHIVESLRARLAKYFNKKHEDSIVELFCKSSYFKIDTSELSIYLARKISKLAKKGILFKEVYPRSGDYRIKRNRILKGAL